MCPTRRPPIVSKPTQRARRRQLNLPRQQNRPQRPPPHRSPDLDAQDEEPQGRAEADRRERQRQAHPRERLARSPSRDQVLAPDPALRRQVDDRPRARQAGQAPAAVPLIGQGAPTAWHGSSAASPPIAATSVS